MITGYVTGQALRFGSLVIAADTIDYLEAQFVFLKAQDWDECTVIRVILEKGNESYSIPLTDGFVRKEDHMNLSAGVWAVHLVGSVYTDGLLTERITTEQADLVVKPAGSSDGPPLPDIPATEAERLDARVKRLEEYGGGGEGTFFAPGNALELKEGLLNVLTTDTAEEDNTLPITSAGVRTIVGNIGAILDTI